MPALIENPILNSPHAAPTRYYRFDEDGITDYNGDSFFVRHAYFLGGGDPYEKLKRALRAEVDEAEWAKLYSARSLPFDPPPRGKVAIKVINHYGDEVLKVYALGK